MNTSWLAFVSFACMGIMVGCAAARDSAAAAAEPTGTITLTAKDLYAGFDARKVTLDEKAGRLALDWRVFEFGKERQGVVCTDPIDLGQRDGIIGGDAAVTGAEIEVMADVPAGASVTVETRAGANMLDTAGWSDWKKLNGLKGDLGKLSGRYVQVRIVLAGTKDALPALTGLVLQSSVVPAPRAAWPPLAVVKADIQKIVRSPIQFHYERPDQKDLAAFRKAAKLDEVVAGAKDDFEKLVKLMDWVASCRNLRGTKHEVKDGRYAWHINYNFGLEDGKPTVYGHCMSYCSVMVDAAIALGYVGARHMAMVGFREASHEVCDIWVPSLGKWVYFDPSLSQYYFDLGTKAPLNIIEMHDIVAANFVPEGKDMHWWIQRSNREAQEQVRKVGGQKPIGSRLGPSKYGEPMPSDYNWGWSHGYLCAGFIQMTARNDFHTNPDKASKRLGSYPGYDDQPFWVDAKTPPTKGGHNWYTRKRDFYWTLGQASVNLVRSGADEVRVELGNSMPFFKEYRITVGGGKEGAKTATGKDVYDWKLSPGVNTLEVAPVDEFGKAGLGSTVVLKLGG